MTTERALPLAQQTCQSALKQPCDGEALRKVAFRSGATLYLCMACAAGVQLSAHALGAADLSVGERTALISLRAARLASGGSW